MAKWEELPLADRAQYLRIAVKNGYNDIRSIREAYNSYEEGGFINPYSSGQKYKESDECAYFSNHTLNDQGYMMSGNAWTPRGIDMIFNGFEGAEKPDAFNEEEYNTYAKQAIDKVYSDFKTREVLDPKKVYGVNMYYASSPNKEKAFTEGDTVYGTHTGYLNYEPKDDTWYVTHNIHGTVHKDKFGKIQNSKGKIGVTAIYEPRKATLYNRIKTKLGYKEGGFMDRPIVSNQEILGLTPKEWGGVALDMMPIVGTIRDAKQFYEDPSWANAGMLGLSVLSEFPIFKLAKVGKIAKAAKHTDEAIEAAKELAKQQRKLDRMRATPGLNPKKVQHQAGIKGKAFYDNLVKQRLAHDSQIDAMYFDPSKMILTKGLDVVSDYGQALKNAHPR